MIRSLGIIVIKENAGKHLIAFIKVKKTKIKYSPLQCLYVKFQCYIYLLIILTIYTFISF